MWYTRPTVYDNISRSLRSRQNDSRPTLTTTSQVVTDLLDWSQFACACLSAAHSRPSILQCTQFRLECSLFDAHAQQFTTGRHRALNLSTSTATNWQTSMHGGRRSPATETEDLRCPVAAATYRYAAVASVVDQFVAILVWKSAPVIFYRSDSASYCGMELPCWTMYSGDQCPAVEWHCSFY